MAVQTNVNMFSLTKDISSGDCVSILIDELNNCDDLKGGELEYKSSAGKNDNTILTIQYSHESVRNEFDGLISIEKRLSTFSKDHEATPCALKNYDSLIIENSVYAYDIVLINTEEPPYWDADILATYLKLVLESQICRVVALDASIDGEPKVLIKPFFDYRLISVFNIYRKLLNIGNINISIERRLSGIAKLAGEQYWE